MSYDDIPKPAWCVHNNGRVNCKKDGVRCTHWNAFSLTCYERRDTIDSIKFDGTKHQNIKI